VFFLFFGFQSFYNFFPNFSFLILDAIFFFKFFYKFFLFWMQKFFLQKFFSTIFCFKIFSSKFYSISLQNFLEKISLKFFYHKRQKSYWKEKKTVER